MSEGITGVVVVVVVSLPSHCPSMYGVLVRSLNRSDTSRHLLFVVPVVVSSDSSFGNQPWSVPYGDGVWTVYGVRSTE